MKDTINQIEQVDEKLSILRDGWLDAIPERKAGWTEKIEAILDERGRLMKIRDAKLCKPKHKPE